MESSQRGNGLLRRYRITLVAVVVFCLIGLIVYFTVPPPIQDAPDPFGPNKSLESVITAMEERPGPVSFLGWKNGDTLALPIRFIWNRSSGATLYAITVYDNRGGIVWSAASTDTNMQMEKHITPGAYYVMLEMDGVLSRMVRFVIDG